VKFNNFAAGRLQA